MDISEVELNRLDTQNLEDKLKLYKYIYFGNKLKYYEKIMEYLDNLYNQKG